MDGMLLEPAVTPWVQTWTGTAVDLLDPQPHTIRKTDIVRSLKALVRFNGHTDTPYTVAQHSVFVMRLVTGAGHVSFAGLRLAALLHDAHEAYMGDIVRPVASLPGLAAPIAQLKARLQRAIHLRFGLPATLPAEWTTIIHEADMVALATEKRDLMMAEPRPWGLKHEPADFDLRSALRDGSLDEFGAWLGDLS